MWEGHNLSLSEQRYGPDAGPEDELWSTPLLTSPDLYSVSHTCFPCVVSVVCEARGRRGLSDP